MAITINIAKAKNLWKDKIRIARKKKFKALMASGISSFIKRPIKNPVGKTWIKNQMALIKNKKRN